MATYAAYRHIELDNVGYGKKRVLKPPGGGSSDIFGAGEAQAQRRVKNHLASNVFLSDEPAPSTPSRTPVVNGETNGDRVDSPATPNGNASPVSNGNGPITNGGTTPTPAAPRQRVPPGGFSSGLW